MTAPHRDRLAPSRPTQRSTGTSRTALAALMLNQDLVDHVHRMTWLLTDGDFEALVLWCALASRNGGQTTADGSAQVAQPARPTPLKDLVAATGVPRETARRKLERLASQGKVDRLADGWVVHLQRLDPSLRTVAGESARLIHEAVAAARAALKLE